MTNPQDPQDVPDSQNMPGASAAPAGGGPVAPPLGCPAHAGAALLYGPEYLRNPTESYQRMRKEHGQVAPVLLESDVPAWLVLGYREVRQVITDVQTFGRDSRRWNRWDEVPSDWSLLPWVAHSPMMHFTEGDEHRRRSAAVSDALSAVDPFELRAHCERFADWLIDKFAGRGTADLVLDYVYSVPALAMGQMFGLPEERLEYMAEALTVSLLSTEDAMAAQRRAAGVVEELVRAKRESPGPDITSRFIQNSPDLTDEQLVGDLMVMMAAGMPATSYWIGNTVRLMLTDSRFAVTLAGGRRSIGEAMNEVLWADSPLQNVIGRFATRDTTLGGQRIRAGDLLVLGLAAANADPLLWPDSTAGFAGNNAHVAFTGGDYGCPTGAPELGKIISETAIEVLLDRIPDLTLAVAPEELEWADSLWYRCLVSFPVTFTPAPAAGQAASDGS
ncbi:cytochrome P450 [Streptomyces hygroscopicus subsp. hygroscopicus]|uniref:Cytochrome P450 n=1 Tax=Streptomyces demainii TaxID=588122 RepID=A0ABT9KPY3_9ACTN|nr:MULTISPECIES: cytochrome P450 [Streptomyces]MBW8089961.1 cytochrome P450 [Streptomyces hygroscopicus subsp. hygroscopicus]MCO8302286.1 cytochrome P450 [Streptomyces sp. RKCA744]MDP9610487.1 cytochrome P450 [Streptomyces demainii]